MSCLECQLTPTRFRVAQQKIKQTLMKITFIILLVLLVFIVTLALYVVYELHAPFHLFEPIETPKEKIQRIWNDGKNFFCAKLVIEKPNSETIDHIFERRVPFQFSSIPHKSTLVTEIKNPQSDLENLPTHADPVRSTLPSYDELLNLVRQHLKDQNKTFQEEDFKAFVRDCYQLYPPDPQLLEQDEKRLEHCIRQSIENWSYWNKIKLKLAIDRYKPKFGEWIKN